MTYVVAIALALVLPLLVDIALFMKAVRRQQARADVAALETLMQMVDAPLQKPSRTLGPSETMLINSPPHRGSFIGNNEAVRVDSVLLWRSPVFRRMSLIKAAATVTLLPTRTGEKVVARVE